MLEKLFQRQPRTETTPLFQLGNIERTRSALDVDVQRFLDKHQACIWDTSLLSNGEIEQNRWALKNQEGRITSRWHFDEENIIEINTSLKRPKETTVEIYPVSEMMSRAWMPRFTRLRALFGKGEER